MKQCKAVAFGLLCVFLTGVLTGCGDFLYEAKMMRDNFRFERRVVQQWEEEQAELAAGPMAVTEMTETEIAEKLLTCLSKKDAEGIKTMLCLKTRQMPDIDAQLQAAFDLFVGNVLSYDDYFGGSEGKSTDYGRTVSHDKMWFIDEVQTDVNREYRITVRQYLESLNVAGREGIVQFQVGSRFGVVSVGYEWLSYSATGKQSADDVLDAIRGGNKQIFCQKTRELPNFDKQFEKAAKFIAGGAFYDGSGGDTTYNGLWDNWARVVQQEDVENQEAVRVYLEVYGENIRIGKNARDKVFTMEIYFYHINVKDKSLAGVMQVVLRDEAGNSCVIGKNFHTG